jgi:hypothetical protein
MHRENLCELAGGLKSANREECGVIFEDESLVKNVLHLLQQTPNDLLMT